MHLLPPFVSVTITKSSDQLDGKRTKARVFEKPLKWNQMESNSYLQDETKKKMLTVDGGIVAILLCVYIFVKNGYKESSPSSTAERLKKKAFN